LLWCTWKLLCWNSFLCQGATIKTDEETGKIVIARIMHGGAADRSGLIHVGDEVCEVNGINVEGKTPNDVLKILVSNNTAPLCMKSRCKPYISPHCVSSMKHCSVQCTEWCSLRTWSGCGMKLITHHHLVRKLSMMPSWHGISLLLATVCLWLCSEGKVVVLYRHLSTLLCHTVVN